MACEFEFKVFELDDLPAPEQAQVREHLVQCAECRELAGLLKEADVCLQKTIRVPSLSPQFDTRLREKIAGVALGEAEREQRKQQAQAEFEAEMERLRRNSWNALQILDGIGWVTLALAAGWLVSLGVTALGKNYQMGGMGWMLGAGVSALVLFSVGLALTISKRTRFFGVDE